jgi:S-adenosylmethionine:tRNA ribosyltransferase-isomerase
VASLTLPTDRFDYQLPQELIAQQPSARRSGSRLLFLGRDGARVEHRRFTDLPAFLKPGDCLVLNETKVLPARLMGRKSTGASVELLLLSEQSPGLWEALCKPARRLSVGSTIVFEDGLSGTVVEEREAGKRLVRFTTTKRSLSRALSRAGRLALPPYIREPLAGVARYQTVYAATPGSVAAPTAGLHFTGRLLSQIESAGIKVVRLTLHIGLDTFRPIQSEDLRGHQMHSEEYEVPAATAEAVNRARAEGGRVVAVGTTTVRALESAATESGPVRAGGGRTDLFITPGYRFRAVDLMLTNFHLPKSTLLVMISAFAGREAVMSAYEEAIREGYRFYSFGDAMLIERAK